MTFEITRKASIATDPCERPFDDPPFWQDDEAAQVRAFDDLDFPTPGDGDDPRHFRSLISSVGVDFLDERKARPDAAQETASAVSILNVGG